PKMLPADAAVRARLLETIRRIAQAAGSPSGDRAQRLAQVERLFAGGTRAAVPGKRRRQAA
ncbi:MAG TPA: hypothetical protein PL196_00240, partial [Burkholderiaceae bacterium]|nr:hypothetical protein [Burkholderiaceae bacterium]